MKQIFRSHREKFKFVKKLWGGNYGFPLPYGLVIPDLVPRGDTEKKYRGDEGTVREASAPYSHSGQTLHDGKEKGHFPRKVAGRIKSRKGAVLKSEQLEKGSGHGHLGEKKKGRLEGNL